MTLFRAVACKFTSLSSDRVSGALLYLLAIFILWQNRHYPIGILSDPGAGFLPLLLGLAFAVTSLVIAWYGVDAVPLNAIGWIEAPRAILVLAACAVAMLVFEWAGYRLTLFGLLVFLLGVVERKPVLNVLLTAAGFSLISFYVFYNLLDVQLPLSPLGF